MTNLLILQSRALAEAVLDLETRGEAVRLQFAFPSDLGAFVPKQSDCHENARRFCEEYPGYTVVGGWIVQSRDASGGLLIRHSVVSDAQNTLTCVTLAAFDQHMLAGPFVRHDPKWGEFKDFAPLINYFSDLGIWS